MPTLVAKSTKWPFMCHTHSHIHSSYKCGSIVLVIPILDSLGCVWVRSQAKESNTIENKERNGQLKLQEKSTNKGRKINEMASIFSSLLIPLHLG